MGKTYVFRVKPNEELLTAIKYYCDKSSIHSAVVTHIIGSFSKVTLGFLKTLPGKYITKEFKGPLEIVCCQGTIATMDHRKEGGRPPSSQGELVMHIHGMVSDESKSIGGHINEAIVFSTAEVCLEELDFQLKRKADAYTGLKEISQ
jgi:predicted DNA-binding protein with PD1-like motif